MVVIAVVMVVTVLVVVAMLLMAVMVVVMLLMVVVVLVVCSQLCAQGGSQAAKYGWQLHHVLHVGNQQLWRSQLPWKLHLPQNTMRFHTRCLCAACWWWLWWRWLCSSAY